eukprot:6514671-Ditylum_brightwellii.AAC.1
MMTSGLLLKHTMLLQKKKTRRKRRKGVYHVAIMPCHDKKLEAGRKDFVWNNDDNETMHQDVDDEKEIADVDLVITTDELLDLLKESVRTSVTTAMIPTNEIKEEEEREVTAKDVYHYLNSLSLSKIVTDPTKINEEGEVGMPVLITRPIRHSSSLLPQNIKKQNDTTNQVKNGISKIRLTNSNNDDTTTTPPNDEKLETNGTNNNNDDNDDVQSILQMIGSGGYAEFIFRYACYKLFHHVIPTHDELDWKKVTRGFSSSGGGSVGSHAGGVRRRTIKRRTATAKDGGGGKSPSDLSEIALYQFKDGSYSLQSCLKGRKRRRNEDNDLLGTATTTINNNRNVLEGHDGNDTFVQQSKIEQGEQQHQIHVTKDEKGQKEKKDDAEEEEQGVPVLKFAIAYGFKNVQLVLQKLGKNKKQNNPSSSSLSGQNNDASNEYHYIEVMACPSGCLNGGGQIRDDMGIVVAGDGSVTKKNKKNVRETPAETRERVKQNRSIMDTIMTYSGFRLDDIVGSEQQQRHEGDD